MCASASTDRNFPSLVAFEDRQQPQPQAFRVNTTFPQPQASTHRPKPISYPSILPYICFSIDVGERLPPHCISFVASHFVSLSRPLSLLLGCFHPSFCTPSQALVRSWPTKESLHVLICQSYNIPPFDYAYGNIYATDYFSTMVFHFNVMNHRRISRAARSHKPDDR